MKSRWFFYTTDKYDDAALDRSLGIIQAIKRDTEDHWIEPTGDGHRIVFTVLHNVDTNEDLIVDTVRLASKCGQDWCIETADCGLTLRTRKVKFDLVSSARVDIWLSSSNLSDG